jgi:anti-sigma factor RsiW
VHAYVDGELDLVRSLEVEEHLSGCVAREQASLRALRTAFSNGALYHEAPARLERRVRTALRDAPRAGQGRGVVLARFGWRGAAAAAVDDRVAR